MDPTRFNNLQNKTLAINMKLVDRIASDAQKLETTMRKEIAAHASVAVADRDRVFSDKLSEAAIRLPAFLLNAITKRLPALRDDCLTKLGKLLRAACQAASAHKRDSESRGAATGRASATKLKDEIMIGMVMHRSSTRRRRGRAVFGIRLSFKLARPPGPLAASGSWQSAADLG